MWIVCCGYECPFVSWCEGEAYMLGFGMGFGGGGTVSNQLSARDFASASARTGCEPAPLACYIAMPRCMNAEGRRLESGPGSSRHEPLAVDPALHDQRHAPTRRRADERLPAPPIIKGAEQDALRSTPTDNRCEPGPDGLSGPLSARVASALAHGTHA